jgi:hypothetical protein
LLLGLALGTASGCARGPGDLLIATSWSAAERTELASAFGRWVEAASGTAGGPVRIRWIRLAPGDDAAGVVRRWETPDVLLGGGAVMYRRLAHAAWLVPIERTGHPLWCVARSAPIVMIEIRTSKSTPGWILREPPRPTFDDVRHDGIALEWARGELAAGAWAEGYARLVRAAATPRRIGRQTRSALAVVERGEAPLMTPGFVKEPGVQRVEDARGGPAWVEGVAVIRGGRNPGLAQEFIRFLASRGGAATPPEVRAEDDPEALALLADLLGATLVDAQDELWAAWAMLEQAGHPKRAEHWMTEPPPWPPASVAKLIQRRDEGGVLLDTLLHEIVPEADLRNWLLRSWLAEPRLVDGRLLQELAGAGDGRLAREPRFRAWLRGEWTAWARQRYRRVARQVATSLGAGSGSGTGSGASGP